MSRTISHRPILICAVAASSLLGLGPAAAASQARAAKHSARHGAKRSNPAGVVFGGVTSQGLPVAIEVSRDGREVVVMAMAMPLTCQQSGASIILPAVYKHAPISASGAFQDSFEGSDSEGTEKGTVTGRFNQSMTTVSTTWTVTLTVHSSMVNDMCVSGAVSFTAIQ
jgi:hypothetical protein